MHKPSQMTAMPRCLQNFSLVYFLYTALRNFARALPDGHLLDFCNGNQLTFEENTSWQE